MRVVIAFARKLRRTKIKGRQMFSKHGSKRGNPTSKSNVPHSSAVCTRTSIEKRYREEDSNEITRSLEVLDSAPAFSMGRLPPTYAESISSQPLANSGTPVSESSKDQTNRSPEGQTFVQKTSENIKGWENENLASDSKVKPATSATSPSSSGRGRSIEIFYRSQLSDLTKRKMMWRPSPLKNKRKKIDSQGLVDDFTALNVQRHVLHWWGHIALSKALILLGILAAWLLFLLDC